MQSMVLSRESISSVYAIVIPVRPLFATSSFTQSTGIHSDSVIGTALRRACGASCIRLHKYVFIIDAFLACNESVLDQDRGSQRREVLWSSIGPMHARNKNFGPPSAGAHTVSVCHPGTLRIPVGRGATLIDHNSGPQSIKILKTAS